MIVRFFILQLKQTIKMLLKESVGLLAAFVLIIIGLVTISKMTNEEKSVSLMKVGISVSQEDEMSRLALGFISDYDSVQSICEFVEVDSEDIVPLMEEGKLDAAILIPDSFVEAADSGENIPATFYFLDEKSGRTKIFKELIFDALRYIQISQGTVYAAFNVAAESKKLQIDYYSIGDYLAKKLFFQWGKRDRYFETMVVSPFGSFRYFQFYSFVALLLVLVIQMCHMNHLYDKPAKAVEQYLKHKGLNSFTLAGLRSTIVFIVLISSSCAYYGIIALLKWMSSLLELNLDKIIVYPAKAGTVVCLCIFLVFGHMVLISTGQIIKNILPRKAKIVAEFAIVLGLIIIVGNSCYRNTDVSTTGIYIDNSSQEAVKLGNALNSLDTQLDIIIYDDISKLNADVANEKIDNGFLLTEDKSGKIKIEGMAGAFSFGSLVAQETIYTQIYSTECLKLLLREADSIFADGKNVKESLEKEFYIQNKSDAVIQPIVREIEPKEKHGHSYSEKRGSFFVLSIIVLLCLLILLLNVYEKVLSPEGKAIALILRGERVYIIKSMAITAGTVALAFAVNILLTGRGDWMVLTIFPIALAYSYFIGYLFSDITKYRQYKSVQLLIWMVIVVFMIGL